MKLWQKDFSIAKEIETFTIGKDRELDLLLAKYDVQGSIAHTKMLESIGLLTSEELQQLEIALKRRPLGQMPAINLSRGRGWCTRLNRGTCERKSG